MNDELNEPVTDRDRCTNVRLSRFCALRGIDFLADSLTSSHAKGA